MCDSGLVIRLLMAFNADMKYQELMDKMNQLMWVLCIEAICLPVSTQQDVSPTERLNKLISKSDLARKIGESNKLDPDLIQLVTIPSRKVCIKNYIGESALGKIYDGEIAGRKINLRDIGDHEISNIKRAAIISNVIRHCDYILRIYGVCELNGCNYIVSEYVSHTNTLRNILNTNKQLSIRRAVEYSLCIAQALEYIHKCNIIHKDIRTNNVYLTSDGYIKLTGFEMSRSKFNPTVRFANMDSFVKKWWAPEKLLGKGDSFACDVYSFGNLMWELITGDVPFANYMTNEATYKIISGQRETFPQNTFQPYVDIIIKCWNHNPNQRPSMSELTEMLERC
ncbi:hypothetical protein K7432_017056 [Basidiobolus ranarum]|uniref:Protein kinase domain-containing protein n=1 Tax=Basidiobolus ranarum TaxID=34480 RepID=A0ABR2VL30_9FUNG